MWRVEELVQVLQATLSPDVATREPAEAYLKQHDYAKGYIVGLMQVATDAAAAHADAGGDRRHLHPCPTRRPSGLGIVKDSKQFIHPCRQVWDKGLTVLIYTV